MVGLCQHLAHVQGIAVVEEELQVKGGEGDGKGRGSGGREKGEGVGERVRVFRMEDKVKGNWN